MVIGGIKHGTFQDGSGKITIIVWEVEAPTAEHHFINYPIELDTKNNADAILIGGGAEGTEAPEGALLTALYPDPTFTKWFASSKDHINNNLHKLRVFAISLQIQGLNRKQLLTYVKQFRDTSALDPIPKAVAKVDRGYVLIGGGFDVDWITSSPSGGVLATASFPSGPDTWEARARKLRQKSEATLTCYAIGIHQSIGAITVDRQFNQSSPEHHPSATAVLGAGFALTGVGAFANYPGWSGNFLWKLRPTTQVSPAPQAAEVASKDHIDADIAPITAYALGIKL